MLNMNTKLIPKVFCGVQSQDAVPDTRGLPLRPSHNPDFKELTLCIGALSYWNMFVPFSSGEEKL